MKRKTNIITALGLVCLIGLYFHSGSAFCSDNVPTRESVAEENIKIKVPDYKVITARIYSDWQMEISRFNPQQMYVPFSFTETKKLVKGRISNRSILLDESEILSFEPGSNTIVLLNPYDQDDNVVRQFLGNNVYVLQYVKGSNLRIPSIIPNGSLKGAIVDCEGKPFAGRQFEIFLSDVSDPTKVRLTTASTDENGKFDIPQVNDSSCKFYIYIKDPNYGSFFAQIINSPIDSTITLPAVSNQSKFFERSIWGTVSASDGRPVAGALVDCQFVFTAAGAKITAFTSPYKSTAITDEQGRFARTINIGQSSTERQIPALSNYYVSVKPPETSGLLSFSGLIQNGRDTRIVLHSAGPMRKFVFEDANGIITDTRILRDLSLYIECADGNKMRLAYNEWKHGRNAPPGKYYVDVHPTTKLKFPPVEVNDQPLIVFQAQGVKNKLYWGQVIDGISGQPMGGVFVASTLGGDFDLSAISPQQWNELQTLPLNPYINDKALKFLREILPFRKITRTDSTGNFQMPVETIASPISFDEFVIFQQNYLPLRYRFFRSARVFPSDKTIFADDGDGIIQFDTIPMFPGATVLFEPNCPSENTRLNVRASYIEPPKWFSDFLARPKGNKMSLLRIGDMMQANANRKFHLSVPAGVNLQIIILPSYLPGRKLPENAVMTPVITDVINCSPGQVLDLGEILFVPEIPVFVKVIDATGKPLEGIEVKAGTENGSLYFYQKNITDANGIARLMVPVGYKISFIVGRLGSLPRTPLQTMPFLVNSPQDANSIVAFQLTDETIKDLYDPNALKDNPALKVPILLDN